MKYSDTIQNITIKKLPYRYIYKKKSHERKAYAKDTPICQKGKFEEQKCKRKGIHCYI